MASRPTEPSKRANSSFVHTLTEASMRSPTTDSRAPAAHLGLAHFLGQRVQFPLAITRFFTSVEGSITEVGRWNK